MLGSLATALITALFSVLTFLVGLMPTFDWPDLAGYITGSSSDLYSYLRFLNWFFPVGWCVNVTALWVAAIFAYKAFLLFKGLFDSWTSKLF